MALVIAALALPSVAKASQINFTFDTQFSNGTLPGGPAPWMSVNINDQTAAPGMDVRITMLMFGLTGSEFITKVYLSLDPVKYPLGLLAWQVNVLQNDNNAFTG